MSEQNNKNSGNQGKPQGGGNKKFQGGPKFSFNFYWIYGIIIVVLIVTQLFSWGPVEREISFDRFERTMLLTKDVSKIEVTNEVAHITIKPEKLKEEKYKDIRTKSFGKTENLGPHYYLNTGPVELFAKKVEEAQKEFTPDERVGIVYKQDKGSYWDFVLNWILPIGFFALIWILIMRRMGGGGAGSQIFNIGKSKAQLFDKDLQVKVTFNDVAGLEEAKVEVMEIVDFLKNPKKYTSLGGKIPRGALLVGPPGTGKTLLAKAMAGEAQVPFFSLSGSDFVEMFVGVGASRVRDLFRQAKEKAPCIIFIDEIDAIGRARGKSPSFSANDERESTLNQLLTEMDGFGSNSGVIIIAATNRADILDRALLRPGRFDRQIYVELPDLNGRKAIFNVHLKPLKINDTLDIDFLARQTPGFSGADIANVCNEAALIAARRNKASIDKQDFLDAIDRIIGGLEKKNKIISPQEKEVIAYHEAGHASVSWLLEHAHPLVKVTIVPRGNSLGAAWYLPEERSITTKEQLMDEICAALGGRAAEEIIFGKVSTGALSDLEKITKQAYAMVTVYGLNEKIGNISFYDSSGQQEYTFGKPYSEQTAQVIDQEVKIMIEEAYNKTKKLLNDHKDQLSQLAKRLLEKEVLFKEDLERIFGKRPWPDKHEPAMTVMNGNGEHKPAGTKSESPEPKAEHSGPTEIEGETTEGLDKPA
ncbi:MAG: ATP-dependent metallopeptidase FtsH/Yme1/Tma family protein [Bacteroidetes bacterium]|nr:MAG: ATP-dependent metallopeptidase FtsH/Yme1/Tma family protein [Bacteroidota bacterium]REK00349.1 MAG: ATP-dependent metallopeptidase FtsH/Yme1/Tma family protein [Bacteroidota bacterium]REK35468.1 MAG: ATP-dependent metallopeptidase FtsH/Yme1/Tma family protein [Bacteroidota bacterium]REK46848.1 MAG: ATP-dependent metallopeptidase FtsH/Yme1/Tma family protein [Bacteroidota bacterium]